MRWAAWMCDPDRPARQALLQQKRDRGEDVPDDRPILWPENEEAAHIYFVTRRQCIVSMGQPMDLDVTAVKAAMDVYGVQDQARCLSRVLRVWRELELPESK